MPDFVVKSDRFLEGKNQTPQLIETISAAKMEATINVIDTEDAVKYLPSVFMRKRNNGDTQAVMATRVWGTSSSARSLIYGDGVLLSALIANNNSIGGPRWGMVAPAEIEHVDMLYGPFSAAYSGNSMGAVMEISTRMPETFEATVNQTEVWQDFKQYGTKADYFTHQTAVNIGNRAGKFSFWISGNFQDSHSQPLSYVTSATILAVPAAPTDPIGAITAFNKLNARANIVGASGLLHTRMINGKIKVAYEFTPWMRASYSYGFWQNKADAKVETYLKNSAGLPTYAGLAGFATGTYALEQENSAHSFTLRTDTKQNWDFEAVASHFSYGKDKQRSPTTASATADPSLSFGNAGRVAVLEGTGWTTLDLKGVWRPDGTNGPHSLSFGAHSDRYRLFNPTYNTADWRAASPTYTSVATEGDGKTRTNALWLQDVWQAAPSVKVTLGTRFDDWRGYDGYNVNGAIKIIQPEVSRTNWSPKGSVTWLPSSTWTVTGSIGKAYRYATAAELYQLVSTGTTFTSPNPDLKPDDALSTELTFEHQIKNGRVRLSLFQDDVHDAIISQFKPLLPGSTQLYSYISNVDHVRARGVEFVLDRRDIFVNGLDFTGSVTYLDARTLALSGQASATAAPGSAIGKRLPNIPQWRATFLISYRHTERLTFSVGGRYSSKLYSTLDNTDVNFNTYQAFSGWFAADVRAHYRIDNHWAASLGIDNVLNREYFLFHVFPKRSTSASVKYSF